MRPIALALSCLFLGSCIEHSFSKLENEDVFNQLPATQVDVLLVVDNSCSMQPYQDLLSENFDAFLTYFEQGDVDYHIGVLTTTLEAPEYLAGYTCAQGKLDQIPDGGELVDDTYITTETEDGAELFSDLVNVGVCGTGYEMGLESARLAVAQAGESDGFYRDDAYLSIIFVSDEQDGSPLPVNDYVNAFREVKGQKEREAFNASSLVVTDPDECTNQQLSAGGGSMGTRYIDVAEQSNGILGNICAQDFGDIVTELSLATSRLRDTFYLSDMPDVSTLEVGIDEEVIDCETGRWTFQKLNYQGETVGAVVFDRTNMPPPQSRITVRYDKGGGDEKFCKGKAGSAADSGDTGGER